MSLFLSKVMALSMTQANDTMYPNLQTIAVSITTLSATHRWCIFRLRMTAEQVHTNAVVPVVGNEDIAKIFQLVESPP
jgi:hypothetical protein